MKREMIEMKYIDVVAYVETEVAKAVEKERKRIIALIEDWSPTALSKDVLFHRIRSKVDAI